MAASHGVVSLGIVVIMRGGLVSFGQGLFFALGGYAAALAVNRLGITDAVLPDCSSAASRPALVGAPFAAAACRATAASSSAC